MARYTFPNRPSRRRFTAALAGAAAATALSGPIYSQVIPPQATTRSWDAVVSAAATYNWGDAVNWSADTLPGVLDIANFSPAPAGQITVELGAVEREVGSLFFSGNGASFYQLQNGTIVTSSINQNNDDGNVLAPTALVRTKNGGLDVLNVSISSNQLQLQGRVTSGGLNKFGGGTLRLGTSTTDFNNVINGDIAIYGGTLTASANATSGANNPLGGTGDIVIGNSGVTLSLQANAALATNVDYDFVRDIRAGTNSFTINASLAAGTDAADPNMRVGTLFIGSATLTTSQGSGFRVALDGINMAAGSTNTRLQAGALTFVDGLTGDASSNLYKRGTSDLEIRGNNEATFSGDIFNGEGNVRLLSTGAGQNPSGGSDSTLVFSNGYGITAIDGGQTFQLRSDASIDFGSNVAFRPGVTIGRIDVNRVGGSATNQTISLGDVNVSGKTLRILGGNGYTLGLDNVILDAGATTSFDAASANVTVTGNLTVGAGATFNKIGGNTLTLTSDNSATAVGTINLRAGTITGTVAGSLGSTPITVGNLTPNTAGYLADFSRLNYNAPGASANATGPDAIAVAGGVIDLNATPAATDVFDIRADGRIQGNSTQLSALNAGAGGNLILVPNAIVVHEEPGAATATVTGLQNNASVFYGISTTANTVPVIGSGTPWKGISGDNTARSIIGTGGVPAVVSINGGDNNPATIEATFQSMNDQNLDFGSSSSAETYQFLTTAAGGEKVTLAIRGALGSNGTLGLAPGGRVVLRDDATSTGLAAAVDKVIVQSGTFSVQTVNGLGGVPVDVLDNGALDIGGIAGNILDGNVAIKSGGALLLNDNQVLGGSGTITIEGGGKLDISGSAPANIFTGSSQAITFTGTGHTVRFAANNIGDLDVKVPDSGVTYVVAGGTSQTTSFGETNLGTTAAPVVVNTQTAGLTIDNGTLTNDGATRILVGGIALNNSPFRIAATRGTTIAVASGIATTGSVQVGSDTAIDGRDKNQNPDRVSALGLADPHNGHSQVLFLGPVTVGGSMTAANGTRLGFADGNTNIAGDLVFNGTVLYLDGGGDLSGGASTKGGLTARLTSTTGLATDRVANNIILGDNARVEMSIGVGTGIQTITQPFVVTGVVNPLDKRTFWVDRAEGAGTVSALLSDITLKNNSQFGIDESNVAVRTNLKLDGNSTLVRNHDDYDLRDVVRGPAAPANVTLFAGEPNAGWDDATEYFVNGSNAGLVSSVDGTIGAGVTIDLIRSQLFFEQNAILNGVVRTQTAPNRGDAFVVSRSSGLTTPTTFTGAGEIQLGRSVAANGPEDFDIRGTEVATGNPAPLHTVAVPVRVVNDGVATNIDGVIRGERNNDSNVTALTQLNTLNVDAGAAVQLVSVNSAQLTVSNVNLGANGAIDSTNNTHVFIGNVVGGANAIRFTGPALARITGNVSASAVNVTGAGLDFDPGVGATSTLNAPLSLSGVIAVRSGTADLGSNIITGAAVQTVPGLRENKTAGAFDETTPNTSNEVKLGPVAGQFGANAFGDNQTFTYTGKINIPDNGVLGDGMGAVSFAKFFDDSIKIVIDGTTYLRNSSFNDGVGSGLIPLSVGLHDIEIRMGNGTGGSGPVGQDGNAFNVGLGIDITNPVSAQEAGGVGSVLDGSSFVLPVDDGSGNLFQTTTVKGGLRVEAGSTLKAGGYTNLGAVTMNGFASTVEITGAGVSDSDSIVLSAGAGGVLQVNQAGARVAVGILNLAGNLTKDGLGTLEVTGVGTGIGSLSINGGTLTGEGSIAGPVGLSAGATIAPGDGVGILGTGDLTLSGGTLAFEINGTGVGTGYDQINAAGNVSLLADTQLTLSLGFDPANDGSMSFTLISNNGAAPISGGGFLTYNGNTLGEGAVFNVGVQPFQLTYAGGVGANDVVLTAVPEPTAFVSMLSGLGVLMGLRRFRRRG
jgi:fibronectin-binding autotransporter adhesin